MAEPGTKFRNGGARLLRDRDLARVPALVGQVAIVLALWELVPSGPQVGIGYLYALPVGCCGWWYGRRAGIEMAAGCLARYFISAVAADVPMLALAASVRGVVLLAAGLAAAQAREISFRGQDVASELAAMREAPTPDQLPEIPGLDVAGAGQPRGARSHPRHRRVRHGRLRRVPPQRGVRAMGQRRSPPSDRAPCWDGARTDSLRSATRLGPRTEDRNSTRPTHTSGRHPAVQRRALRGARSCQPFGLDRVVAAVSAELV